jgi:hypothetical protein
MRSVWGSGWGQRVLVRIVDIIYNLIFWWGISPINEKGLLYGNNNITMIFFINYPFFLFVVDVDI